MEQFLPILAQSPLFEGLSLQELSTLLPRLSPLILRRTRGETLLHSGELAPGIGVLLEGRVHILREDFWGNVSLLDQVEPGQLFAEAFACAHLPLTVRVEATQDSTALFLPPHALMEQAQSQFLPLSEHLLKVLAQKNLMLNRTMGHLTQRTIRAKVLSYLSWQAQQAGTSTFLIPFNRQQLADYLSVDRSALSAELSQMRREGILDVHRSQFTLFSPQR